MIVDKNKIVYVNLTSFPSQFVNWFFSFHGFYVTSCDVALQRCLVNLVSLFLYDL